MLKLVIKGTYTNAIDAAHARTLLPITISGESRAGEILASVPMSREETVRAWFNESQGRAPYPPGTLLAYWPEDR